MIRCISLILLFPLGCAMGAETTITTKQGQSIPVEVVAVAGRLATISRNNVKSTISLDQLVEASQVFVIEAAKVKGMYSAFPGLRAQVSVGTKNRQMASSYRKSMEIVPHLKLAAVSALEPVPALEALMMIIVQDTKAKFVQKYDRYVVHSSETVNVPAAPDGKARDIDFQKLEVTYDAWRDTTNVGGFVYKYYLFALRDPETKKILDFQTNHPQLPAYFIANPEKREELLNLAEKKDFPVSFK